MVTMLHRKGREIDEERERKIITFRLIGCNRSRNDSFQNAIIVVAAISIRWHWTVWIMNGGRWNCVIAIDRDRMPLCHFCTFGRIFRRTNTFVSVILRLIIADDAIIWFLATLAHHVVQRCVSGFFRIFILAFVRVIQFVFLVDQIIAIILSKETETRKKKMLPLIKMTFE